MRIVHIADIHWRGLSRHDEYKESFACFFDKISSLNPDVIYVGGDIVHSKTQGISPELIDSLCWWFTEMSNIAPTHVILGNHDGLVLNKSRQDAISPIIDEIIAEKIQEKVSNLTITEGKGFDYTLNDTEIEWKNSLSNSDSWTGNGYRKTNWHVLCKFIPNEDGVIESYFACIIPYDVIKSNWSETGNSNFSSLKLLKDDNFNIIKVAGTLTSAKKYLKPQFVTV